ncbi:MAG TPA: HPr kinase/phosphatase C-terminal domain-containing protein [Micropepsaceae bacterium]|nr:HPr kinase/phosphatase C-terminal domain-containing protein [Micropepsaceae bacterium]
MTQRVLVHASCVALGEACAPFGCAVEGAVLLLGASGAGKSDVALRLIAMGAQLISDDQTMLFGNDGRLFADAHPSAYGQIEIRGVGIVVMPTAQPAPVILAVRLDEEADIARLPEPATHKLPQGLEGCAEPPFLILRPFEASTPAKIAASAAALARGAFVAGAISPPSSHFF